MKAARFSAPNSLTLIDMHGRWEDEHGELRASLLQRYAAEQVIHVVEGGVPRWKREGWPIDEPTGGFLIVPTLAIALLLAVGTSLIIIATTSVMDLAVHLLAGRGLDIAVTAALTGACVAGALAGVALAERIPQRQLGRGFAGLVVAVAGYLLISVAFLGGPPGH